MKRKIAILGACVIVLAGAVGIKMSSQPATDAVSKSQSKKYEYTDIQQLPDEGWFYPGLRRNVRGNLLIDRKGAEVCRKTI